MFFAALCHCVMGVNMFACCPSGNVLFVFANKPAKLRFCPVLCCNDYIQWLTGWSGGCDC